MVPPTTLETVQLCLVSISVPVYLWFLATIVCFRKKHPFNSSFFILSFVLGICDLQCLFSNWVLGKFSAFGWFYMDELARRFNSQLAKVQTALSVQGCLTQCTAVVVVAFNRCTALAFFDKHELIWTRRFLAGMVALQVLGPALVVSPAIASLGFYYPINNTTGQIGTVSWRNSDWQFYYLAGAFIYVWLVIVVTALLYSATFWQVRQMVSTRQVDQADNNMDSRRSEIRLGLVGLGLAVFLAVYGWTLYKMGSAVNDPALWELYFRVWGVSNDVFSWCNPWLCLTMSPVVREHMLKLLRCQTTTNKTVKSGTRRNIRVKPMEEDRVIELRDQ